MAHSPLTKRGSYILDPSTIAITEAHFLQALSTITPAAQRATASLAAPLPSHLESLLQAKLTAATSKLAALFPPSASGYAPGRAAAFRGAAGSAGLGLTTDIGGVCYPAVCRPHLLLHGTACNGQAPLAAALMQVRHLPAISPSMTFDHSSTTSSHL